MLTKTQIVSSFQTQVFSVSTENVLFHMYNNDCAFPMLDGQINGTGMSASDEWRHTMQSWLVILHEVKMLSQTSNYKA